MQPTRWSDLHRSIMSGTELWVKFSKRLYDADCMIPQRNSPKLHYLFVDLRGPEGRCDRTAGRLG